jgi:hypothetical protein
LEKQKLDYILYHIGIDKPTWQGDNWAKLLVVTALAQLVYLHHYNYSTFVA